MTHVVLLHGIGGAAWAPTLPALVGHEAIDWPLPGYHGAPPLTETSFPAIAAALRDALDARGVRRAVLLGHSIGGMVAQEFALAFPDRVQALILYATTPAFGGRDPAFAEAFLRARLGPLDAGKSMQEAAPEMLAGITAEGADPAAMAAAVAALASVPERVYRATLRCLTTFDRRGDQARIAAPTLLIAAEQDPAAPLRTMERMANAIPGAQLAVIPGAGHLAHLERPDVFNGVVARFLAALPEG